MIKTQLVFISILLFVSYNLKSQTIVKETSVNLFGETEKNAKFTLKTFSVSNGKIIAGAFIQRKATIDNTKMFKVLKEGYFPAVKIFTLDMNLNKKGVDLKNINLNSYTGSNSDYRLLANKTKEIGNNNDDLPYKELQKQYPDILMPKDTKPSNEDYFIELKNVKKRIYETRFDLISNSIHKTETDIEKVSLEYPQTNLIRKVYGYGLSNKENDKYIFVSGLAYDKKERKADPTKKWNESRQYEFNSFDRSGNCLNTFNIDFDYPKGIEFNAKVVTNGEFEGFVYIFGYMTGLKKYNNPETKNKYWAVYFDENGKHIFTKEFESQYGSVFYTAHKYNNELYIFGQGNEGKYGIVRLSASDYKQISINSLSKNTINGEYKQGIKRSFVPVYKDVSVFVSDNGNFLILSENKTTKSVKKGDKVVNVSTYNSFALHFDKEGNFTKQYILPVKNGKSKSFSKEYSFITSTDNKFVLLSNEKISNNKVKPYSIFVTSESGKTATKDNFKHLISPIVTVINTNDSKVGTSALSKEVFYSLSKEVIYALDKNNKSIYFTGTNKDRNKLVISQISY